MVEELRHAVDLDTRVYEAEQGINLDIHVTDPDWRVRELVASHGKRKHLDILILDPVSEVREQILTHEHKKDVKILVLDSDYMVRTTAENIKRKKGWTL